MKKITLTLGSLIFMTWILVGFYETKWLFNIIGYSYSGNIASAEDNIYILSVQPRISKAQFDLVVESACNDITEKCYSNNLSLANVLSVSGFDLSASRNLLKSMEAISNKVEDSCKAKLHLSHLIYAINSKVVTAGDNKKDIARKILADLKVPRDEMPKVGNSCREYFSKNPHIAKQYIYQVATLYAYSDHYIQAPWLFLLMAAQLY
jgi:hypothetical protein